MEVNATNNFPKRYVVEDWCGTLYLVKIGTNERVFTANELAVKVGDQFSSDQLTILFDSIIK